MRLGAFRIELQCLPAGCIRSFKIRFAPVQIHVKKRAAIGDPGMGASEVRVDFDRAIKHAARILHGGTAHLMLRLAAAEIVLVSLHVFGGRFFNCTLLVLP